MINCINFKQRHKKNQLYFYCTLSKKVIAYDECKYCNSKEYKQYKSLRTRTNKLAKKEKERFSIIYHDLNKCAECGLKTGYFDERINSYTKVEKNEVFSGAYRSTSMIDGMVAPLCSYCHKLFHNDSIMNLKYKVKFQNEYLKNHSIEEFINRYGQNYIYKLEHKKRGKDI